MSVEFTLHPAAMVGWSEAFFPTLGRFTKVGSPSDVSSALSPIPECMRRKGVPTEPADRITSFVAWTVKDGAVFFC